MSHHLTVEIIEFKPELTDSFRRLNLEWIERCFEVEPEDIRVLSNPETEIVEPGGRIFFAFLPEWNETVGTCALIKKDETHYELAKMAVTQKARGRKIGQQLLTAALTTAKNLDAKLVTLESSTKLKAAVSMYEKFGFQHVEPDIPSKYESADVFMTLTL